MNRIEFWGAALIDDETGEVLDYSDCYTAGELMMWLNKWTDEHLVQFRATLYFGRV